MMFRFCTQSLQFIKTVAFTTAFMISVSTVYAETVRLDAVGFKKPQNSKMELVPFGKKTLVRQAKFYRVTEGVFDLKMGQSIDLTESRILFTLRGYLNDMSYTIKAQRVNIIVNGSGISMPPGDRVDLKKHTETAKYFEAHDECFVDYVSLIDPKGSKPIGTFRLHCE